MIDRPHIVQVVPYEIGGGAESVVNTLHAGLERLGFSCERVHFCGAPLNGPPVTRFGNRHDSLMNITRLRSLIQKRRQNNMREIVLHSHLTHGFYVSMIARLGLPIRWVHTEHNTTMRLREIRWIRPIERRFYSRCDKIIAISNGVHASLQAALDLPESKIAVVPNGAKDFGIADRRRLGSQEVRIISVGSLSERKGFDTALKALASASIGPWHYTIVGEGPELTNLQNLTDKLGISQKVTFAGWDDPGPFYRNSDLQIIPSRWEGFGLVAVEGMSTGLRVVASDVGGLRGVVGSDPDVALLVTNHADPTSWIEPLEIIVKTLRKKDTPTSLNSAMQAQRFSNEEMVSKHANIYQEIG